MKTVKPSTTYPGHLAPLSRAIALQTLLLGMATGAHAQASTDKLATTAESTLPTVRVTAPRLDENATGPVEGVVAKRSTTGTKTDTPVREVPQSISVVTRDSMDARAVSTLAEALEYTPGFTGSISGHEDRYDQSVIRGIGITANNNLRDGLKEAGSVYARFKQNAYGIERVELLRGPASLLYGSNIPGGAVNAITKRPTLDARNELRLQAGNDGRLGVAGDFSGPLSQDGRVLYRLVASDDQYDAPNPDTRVKSRYFAPALTFRLGNTTELTVLANYNQDRISGDAYPYSYTNLIDAGFGDTYQPGMEKGVDRFNRDQGAIGFLLDHRFNDRFSFHSRTRYSKVKLDYRSTFINDVLGPTLIQRAAQFIKDDARTWRSDNYVEAEWGVAGWANTTIAGLDWSKVKTAQYYGAGLTSDFDLSTNSATGPYIAPPLDPHYLANDRQVGAYVQNQLKIHDRYVVVAGLRKDWYRSDAEGLDSPGSARQDKVTGRLGGVWLLPQGFSPYVSYSTSFEPVSGVDENGDRYKPTTGRQYELGLRYEPVGWNARFTAALFDIVQKNVSTANPDPRIVFPVQRGEVGSRGLELEAIATLTRQLDLIASYSYTNARITADPDPTVVGTKNPYVPRYKATAWFNYRTSQPGLSVGMGARYTSRIPDTANDAWAPGVTLVDARVGYQFDKWEIAVNARNLLNRQYIANREGTGLFSLSYPGDHRSVLGTATYRW